MNEFEHFEDEGLKLDRDRVLTYSQLSCPYDCKYCFVEDMNSNQQRNVTYLTEKQHELLSNLPPHINIIMLGCDTEFFQPSSRASEVLERLSDLDRDISVVTKMVLPDSIVELISSVNRKLNRNGHFISFSESIPCLQSSKQWEPKVPDPIKRIDTLKRVHASGVKTLVAIRPLLPTLPESELEEIVSLTKNCCYGYYSGPLYLKELDPELIKPDESSDLSIKKLQPHWMPGENEFYKIEKNGQMEALNRIVNSRNHQLFEGAAEATNYLRTL